MIFFDEMKLCVINQDDSNSIAHHQDQMKSVYKYNVQIAGAGRDQLVVDLKFLLLYFLSILIL